MASISQCWMMLLIIVFATVMFCTSAAAAVCSGPCPSGTYQSKACTTTSNRVCTACSGACPSGQYQSAACTPTSNRVCTDNKRRLPLDCFDIKNSGYTSSGVYTIYYGGMQSPLKVYCDMTTDGGGWTVFQRRQNGLVNFYRNWVDYLNGFGSLYQEFWLGNEHLYWILSNRKTYRLRIDLADFDGNSRFAVYDNFKICSECCKFRITSLGNYTGNAGDSMVTHLGNAFSTFDQDNDVHPGSCAVQFKGGWWYEACHWCNLNGYYHNGVHASYGDGVEWDTWRGLHYSLRFTEMKIKPRI